MKIYKLGEPSIRSDIMGFDVPLKMGLGYPHKKIIQAIEDSIKNGPAKEYVEVCVKEEKDLGLELEEDFYLRIPFLVTKREEHEANEKEIRITCRELQKELEKSNDFPYDLFIKKLEDYNEGELTPGQIKTNNIDDFNATLLATQTKIKLCRSRL